jgi:transposase
MRRGCEARLSGGDAHDVEHEDLIPADHPIRRIHRTCSEGLEGEPSARHSPLGRASVAPEQQAMVLVALSWVRSERAVRERLKHDLLFRWFPDLAIDAKACDPSTFTKNRQQLLTDEIADRYFAAVSARPSFAARRERSLLRRRTAGPVGVEQLLQAQRRAWLPMGSRAATPRSTPAERSDNVSTESQPAAGGVGLRGTNDSPMRSHRWPNAHSSCPGCGDSGPSGRLTAVGPPAATVGDPVRSLHVDVDRLGGTLGVDPGG